MDDVAASGPISAHLWREAAVAFFTALVLSPVIRDVFRSYNVVDNPGRRKVHAYPIPRLGGIAVAVAFAAGLLSASDYDTAWRIFPGAAVIFLTGALDDFFNLKPVHKLVAQFGAGAVAYASGLRFDNFAGHTVAPWLGVPITVFWLTLATNALNLVDGLDGLCAGISSVASAAFFVAATAQGNSALQRVALALAAALIGFIGYNWNPATMFLGDSGALLAGFLLGGFGLMWNQHTSSIPAAIMPPLILGIPLLDLGLSILRRFLKRRALFSPDRMHVHHRLLDRGLTPRKVVLVLAGSGVIAAVFAWSLNAAHGLPSLGALAAVCGAGVVFGVSRLRYAEFDVALSLLGRRDFRSEIAKEAWIRNLAEAAGRIRNEDDWWAVLTNAAAEAGWTRITWISEGTVIQESRLTRERAGWAFKIDLPERINLAEGEYLEIEGPIDSSAPRMDLIAFADVARQSLKAARRAAQTPVA